MHQGQTLKKCSSGLVSLLLLLLLLLLFLLQLSLLLLVVLCLSPGWCSSKHYLNVEQTRHLLRSICGHLLSL